MLLVGGIARATPQVLEPAHTLSGEHADDWAGTAIAAGGDVDGDGIDDVAIGVSDNSQTGTFAGKVYLLFGRTSGWTAMATLSDADASFLGVDTGDELGRSVDGVGDVNGDGFDDLLLGAPEAGWGQDLGMAYLIFGSPAGWSWGTSLDDATASLPGETAYDETGAVALVGDVNGDGLDDLWVGAPRADLHGTDSGAIHLVDGFECGDADGDGFDVCGGATSVDCDDDDASIYPGAPETCNGLDDDCDGGVDEGFDADADGYSPCLDDRNDLNPLIHPGAAEICDGIHDTAETHCATGACSCDSTGPAGTPGSMLALTVAWLLRRRSRTAGFLGRPDA